MGRYYRGDIEGKFMFAVQSSDDASFFGGLMSEPNVVNYYFSNDALPDVQEGILTCETTLGDDFQKIEDFFKDKNGYNNEMFEKKLGWDSKKTKERLEWYARLKLGRQILECLEKKGECSFEAEL